MGKLYEGMPEIPQEAIDDVFSGFQPFLLYESVKDKTRNYHCTACGTKFTVGSGFYKRTMNKNDFDLSSLGHNKKAYCPHCGVEATVKSLKKITGSRRSLYQEKAIIFVLPKAYDDVWFRGVFLIKDYSEDKFGKRIIHEVCRYHLTPGEAHCFRKDWSPFFEWADDISETDRIINAFQWDCGLVHHAFQYDFYSVGRMTIKDTFLKYSAIELYEKRYANPPIMKYLCWYAVHPQIEMLVKMKHYSVVNDLILTNIENKSYINWEAKKPWELYRLSPDEYKEFIKKPANNQMNILKVYKTIKGKKSFELADTIWRYSYYRIGRAKALIRKIQSYGKTFKEADKYFNKISRESAGCCHQCVGITAQQACQLWQDYINMAEKSKNKKNFSPWPSDLKTAHDNLITVYNIKKTKDTLAAVEKRADAQAKELEKKFPKVADIYKSIKKKYEYDNGKYCLILPENIKEILKDGMALAQCTVRCDLYYDRIQSKESFLGFVRKSDTPKIPWFDIEFEPGGTVRQKRGYGDSQPESEMPIITEFLVEWQNVLRERLTKVDKKLAHKSKVVRDENFAQLRKEKKIINYGILQGTLLVEALEQDLLEAANT